MSTSPQRAQQRRRVVDDAAVLRHVHASDDDSDEATTTATTTDPPRMGAMGHRTHAVQGVGQQQQQRLAETERLSPRQLVGDTMTSEWPTSVLQTEDNDYEQRHLLPRRSTGPAHHNAAARGEHLRGVGQGHPAQQPRVANVAVVSDTLGGSNHNGSLMDLLVGSSSDDDGDTLHRQQQHRPRNSTSTDEGRDDARLFPPPPSKVAVSALSSVPCAKGDRHTSPPPTSLSRKASRALAAKRAVWYREHNHRLVDGDRSDCSRRGRRTVSSTVAPQGSLVGARGDASAVVSGRTSGLVSPASPAGGIGEVDVSSVSETYLSAQSDQRHRHGALDRGASASMWSPEQHRAVVAASRSEEQPRGVVARVDADVDDDGATNALVQRHSAWLMAKEAAARALLEGTDEAMAVVPRCCGTAGGGTRTPSACRPSSRTGSTVGRRGTANVGVPQNASSKHDRRGGMHQDAPQPQQRHHATVITTSSWRQRPGSAMAVDEDWMKLPQRPQFRDDVVDPPLLRRQQRGTGSTTGGRMRPLNPTAGQHHHDVDAAAAGCGVQHRPHVPPPHAAVVPIDAEKDALNKKQARAQRARDKMLLYAEANRVQAMQWQRKHDDKAVVAANTGGGGGGGGQQRGGGGGGGAVQLPQAAAVVGDAMPHHRDPTASGPPGYHRTGGGGAASGGVASSSPPLRTPLSRRPQATTTPTSSVVGRRPNGQDSWDVLKHFVGRPSAML